MFIYPKWISPVAFQIGSLKVHWYGLMYLLGFIGAWVLGIVRSKRKDNILNIDRVSDCIFYGALGVILGGRIGYILFYNFPFYWAHPLLVFAVWDGGMSFHGGLLGVVIAFYFLSRKYKCSLFDLGDFFAPMVPIGLAAGRLGNFINDELWGRVTDSPLGMIFPNGGPLPRYPSQLIEFCLEGVFLFILLWCISRKPRERMVVSSWFLIGYGCVRFIAEFFRQPDPQIGFLAWGWLTEGQALSIPMVLIGIGLLFYVRYRVKRTGNVTSVN